VKLLARDLESPLAERQRLSGGAIDGPAGALSSLDVARHWDEADGTAEPRAMLVDGSAPITSWVLPAIPGTRVQMFTPDRIVLVPADTPFAPRAR
jgi:hypothetical protein